MSVTGNGAKIPDTRKVTACAGMIDAPGAGTWLPTVGKVNEENTGV
jgi:hypothetical protein